MKKANKKATDKVVDVTKVTPEVQKRALEFHKIWKSGERSIPKIAEMLNVKENTLRGQMDTIAAVVGQTDPEVTSRFYYVRKYAYKSAKSKSSTANSKKKIATGQIKSDKKTIKSANTEETTKNESIDSINHESLDGLFDTVINKANDLVNGLETFVKKHSIAESSEANKEELR